MCQTRPPPEHVGFGLPILHKGNTRTGDGKADVASAFGGSADAEASKPMLAPTPRLDKLALTGPMLMDSEGERSRGGL